jgi:F-type H+-transporting ATPase subunit b
VSLAHDIAGTLLVAATEGGGSSEEDSGTFLVSPELGLMIWTLMAFLITLFLLRKLAFPRIQEALDRRRRAIEDSIDAAERTRREADELLEEYRARLREAREQAEDIVVRARKAADNVAERAKSDARKEREDLMERTRRDIESETRRAIDQIRKEVANLTVIATEKVARKTLDDEDHQRLIREALDEFDFSALPGGEQENGGPDGFAAAAKAADERDSEDR